MSDWVSVRLELELRQRMYELARSQDRSLSAEIRLACKERLERVNGAAAKPKPKRAPAKRRATR